MSYWYDCLCEGISNSLFIGSCFGVFLIMRKNALSKAYFRSHLTKTVRVILHYQSKQSITEASYGSMLGKYLLASNVLNLCVHGLSLNQLGLSQDEPNSCKKINIFKLLNPLIFFYFFRLPLSMGLGVGVCGCSIDGLLLSRVKAIVQ